MLRLVVMVAALLVSNRVEAAELRESVWRVTSVERNGQPATDFQISESTNGGPKTILPLYCLEFQRTGMTFLVGSRELQRMHELRASARWIPNRDAGEFNLQLLSKTHRVTFKIEQDVLTLSIADPDQPPEQRLVITATRMP